MKDKETRFYYIDVSSISCGWNFSSADSYLSRNGKTERVSRGVYRTKCKRTFERFKKLFSSMSGVEFYERIEKVN